MATSHVRYQLHLHGPKIGRIISVLLLLAVLPFTAAHAQKKSRSSRGKHGRVKSITVNNLPGYDSKWFHPGFYVAPNFSSYKIQQATKNLGSVASNSIISPGFSVGFIADAAMGDYFNLRFTPGVSFITRRIEFKDAGYTPVPPEPPQVEIFTQEIGTTQIDLPLLLKFKSDRRRNTRVYLIGGVKPSFNLGNRRKDPDRNLLQAESADFAVEYGVGLDLFYPLFKFAPELRFSNGLINLHKPGNDLYSRSLQSMRSNTVTLYLNFE
ncbi:type IX secretion/gliding motility protein PorT/SprT [Hymenobacter jejuensis]|uniref:PorT family protein n=1 Tax=Hymenobacter jejuensis TaxID=2502781 RepID=A0A5B8A6E1_9BACT|nr:porin family protein [Hymenobacter jejuensis]QDA62236.1 PorT family protein [Hymenobacter jejuensis]